MSEQRLMTRCRNLYQSPPAYPKVPSWARFYSSCTSGTFRLSRKLSLPYSRTTPRCTTMTVKVQVAAAVSPRICPPSRRGPLSRMLWSMLQSPRSSLLARIPAPIPCPWMERLFLESSRNTTWASDLRIICRGMVTYQVYWKELQHP